jgi:hypothetical protein
MPVVFRNHVRAAILIAGGSLGIAQSFRAGLHARESRRLIQCRHFREDGREIDGPVPGFRQFGEMEDAWQMVHCGNAFMAAGTSGTARKEPWDQFPDNLGRMIVNKTLLRLSSSIRPSTPRHAVAVRDFS